MRDLTVQISMVLCGQNELSALMDGGKKGILRGRGEIKNRLLLLEQEAQEKVLGGQWLP